MRNREVATQVSSDLYPDVASAGSLAAYERYLANNPNNESRFLFPVNEGPWQDQEDCELVAHEVNQVAVRGQPLPLPTLDEYLRHGIELEQPRQV